MILRHVKTPTQPVTGRHIVDYGTGVTPSATEALQRILRPYGRVLSFCKPSPSDHSLGGQVFAEDTRSLGLRC